MSAMYSTCLFCHRPLGTNGILESFPVGRRLAFDGEKGRLWVVCRRCERWNLSPLDERWEAIEDCERLFRDTRLRVSTDNIGLARVSETLELVRVGRAIRGEFAAWRYGDQFGRRRRRAIAWSAAGAAGVGLVAVGGMTAGVSIGGGWYGFSEFVKWIGGERTAARLRDPDGEQIRVQLKHLERSRLVPADTPEGWALQVAHAKGWAGGYTRSRPLVSRFEGPLAVEIAGKLMARANRRGGRSRTIREAVERIEASGHPERFLVDATRESERLRDRKAGRRARKRDRTDAGSLAKLPDPIRLAVEMATQEEAERRALEGELEILEAAWREAEEVAAIADSLLVPRSVEEFLAREKGHGEARQREGGARDAGGPAAPGPGSGDEGPAA
ncbi:MAG: hypothetical protein RRA92_10930 [Gemmatimonadota bacterium]|nr:hypothetical protein [Gemmatimonadota bacterium]